MALKPCRECGQEVSTEADACPRCGVGYPTEGRLKRFLTKPRGDEGRSERGSGCGTLLMLVIVFIVVVGILSPGSDTSTEGGSPVASSADVRYVDQATNVRAGRSTESSVVGTLYPGDSVSVDAPGQGWWRVHDPQADELLGYVYAPLLKEKRPATGDSKQAEDSGSQRRRAGPNEKIFITEDSPVEAKLAAIDLDSSVLPAATIAKYGRLLDRLVPRCSRSRSRISDMGVAARNQLRDRYGRDMSLLAFFRAVATMMDESGLQKQDCAEAFASLVIVLGNQ